MKKITLSILFSLLLFSCSNEEFSAPTEDNSLTTPNERLTFSDLDELGSTLSSLDNLSLLSLKQWSNAHIKDSYFSAKDIKDSTLVYIPNKLKAILNSDLEYQVGDSIVWYNDSKLYALAHKDINKEDKERLKKDKKNLTLINSFERSSINELLPTSRQVVIEDNKKDYSYNIGHATYNPTPSGRAFLQQVNPGMRAETITVKAELFSYTQPYKDYMEERYATGRVMKWYYMYLKVRLFDNVNGVEVEIKDPILNMQFDGLMTYHYVHNYQMLRPDWQHFEHQGYITNKVITLDNTIEVFKHHIAKNRDTIEQIAIQIFNSQLDFALGKDHTRPDLEMFRIKNINL